MLRPFLILAALIFCGLSGSLGAQDENEVLRVFIFAGQSNMVGSDSRVGDIDRFPPFAGLAAPQEDVMFSYCIGRESPAKSEGWVALQAVNESVGPELSFARAVTRASAAPIAIIKCAAGGTHLGGDWNPDDPQGFKMYPRAMDWIHGALAQLDEKKIPYRIEGFMWHQGENDMFEEQYLANYGKNLKNFLASCRRDLGVPNLKFYIGELCTKTVWGMDLRPRMYTISQAQKEVTEADPLAEYVPTSHVSVQIGSGAGLHYHYGTLGQLEHGVNYATAYLRSINKLASTERTLKTWPYRKGSKVKLFVLAGHRNMEGERAFVQELAQLGKDRVLLKDNHSIAYKYSVGGGYKQSSGWEPLGPAGCYDTFGPELSFAGVLQPKLKGNIAIAKFTHSGSQIIDWTPEGSVATARNLYPRFIEFVKQSMDELAAKGNEVELAGIFYHLGENDMSFGPYRRDAPERLRSLVTQSRQDLGLPQLNWYVSQQPPTDDEELNKIDVTSELADVAAGDEHLIHTTVFDLAPQKEKIVITTEGIVELGRAIAASYLHHR